MAEVTAFPLSFSHRRDGHTPRLSGLARVLALSNVSSGFRAKKEPRSFLVRKKRGLSLAATYSHRTYRPTTIGA